MASGETSVAVSVSGVAGSGQTSVSVSVSAPAGVLWHRSGGAWVPAELWRRVGGAWSRVI